MLAGKPVVVAHSNSAHGTSSVASASYEARKYGTHVLNTTSSPSRRRAQLYFGLLSTFLSPGVSNGMMVGQARELCPDLVAVPYDFDKIEKVGTQLS
jgi:nucleotidyltransferase/DNA polymerase involved in DNA repair